MNYHIARDGQQIGVFDEDDVRRKLQAGDLRESDLCWAEGMAEWKPLNTVVQPAASAAINPYAPPSVDVSRVAEAGTRAPLASLGQRLGAAMLDGLVAIVCVTPIIFATALSETANASANTTTAILYSLGALALLSLVVYNLVRLTQHGQTIGKKWVNIRIATFEDQSNPGFVKAVLLRGFVNGIIASIPVLGPIYSIVDICMIFREDRRCIHDLLAGTQVVQV